MGKTNAIWYPYTQIKTALSPTPIARGEGAYLIGKDGKWYLDAISSWWVNLHGHCHPLISERISKQASILEHAIFAGFTHDPAMELTERLLELLPGSLSKVFFSDNGSTAVETALKMAFQYWFNLDPKTKRKKPISLKNGFHGETFGAMGISERNIFSTPFSDHLFEADFIDPPYEGMETKSVQQLKAILEKEESACFIVEPLFQGFLGGMKKYSQKGLDALLKLCHQYGVLTIADEVLTGFGRTGPLFASEMLEESFDIVCLGKGLSGGFLPIAATACNEKVFEPFYADEKTKALIHGHSYSGNPLGCVAALASLELLEEKQCQKARKMISDSHIRFCGNIQNHPKIKRCETLGTILVIELKSPESSYFSTDLEEMVQFCLKQSIFLRPLGNIIYVVPPYCMNSNELHHIYNTILECL